MATKAETRPIPHVANNRLVFLLQKGLCEDKNAVWGQLLDNVKQDEMAPFYKRVATLLREPLDEALLKDLEAKNEAAFQKFKDQLSDAEKNAGSTEIKDALLAHAEYLGRIGDEKAAVEAYEKAFEKSVGAGAKLDVMFAVIRVGFLFLNHDLIATYINKARKLIEEGGDWDRRNRLKVYEAVYLLSIRSFKRASDLLLETLSTFTCTELLPYKDFIQYAIISSMLVQDRVTLRAKVMHSPEVLEVVRELGPMQSYMNSLYDCDYASFFAALAQVEQIMKHDVYLHAHYRYCVREMRIKAFAQMLESYKSVTTVSMAEKFAVTPEYIDRELSRFIAGGRLNCVIDSVSGVINTNRPDARSLQYQNAIKQGDALLTRVQKLSRVMNL